MILWNQQTGGWHGLSTNSTFPIAPLEDNGDQVRNNLSSCHFCIRREANGKNCKEGREQVLDLMYFFVSAGKKGIKKMRTQGTIKGHLPEKKRPFCKCFSSSVNKQIIHTQPSVFYTWGCSAVYEREAGSTLTRSPVHHRTDRDI